MATRFDDRSVDFHSGKRMSPPMADRRICACCGQRIVKGWLTSGEELGDDCYDILKRAEMHKLGGSGDFAENYKRSTGWSLKPAVSNYLKQAVFA